MKKFLNQVDTVLTESLSGLARAHGELLALHPAPLFVRRRALTTGKVALISGGGSGHEPLHAGFVGFGMLDAAVPGHVFSAPVPDQIIAATEAVDSGAGVLYIVKNYAGDVMNFEVASEMTGRANATVLVDDDVAVENSTYTQGKRGVAGTVIVEKCVGSLAETGADLAACAAFGAEVVAATASMGVALTSCTVPANGRPTFDIGDGEIEMGVGIHGEPGRRREALKPADAIVADLLGPILEQLKPDAGAQLLLHVNGFGATPLMELYLLFDSAARQLEARGLTIARSLVGNYTTSLDMAGASVTVTLLNAAIAQHWDSAVHTPALRWGR